MQMVGLEAARIIFSIFNCFFFFLTYLLTRTFRYCAFTMNYTTEEYVDMIYCYGMARGNARAAERFYAELYPNRNRHPSYHTIIQCYRRARRTGILQRKQYERPVQRCADLDDEILRAFEENPHNSTRRVARTLGVAQRTVWRILRENGLHSYHYQRVQQLLARDQIQRVYFCGGIFIFYFSSYLWRVQCIIQ